MKVEYINHMGDDLQIVNAARVSFGKRSEWEGGSHPDFDKPKHLSEKDQRLIKYLAKHKHLSPFGHAFASFHVKAPIFVARQLVKHKFLRWNEISRRYVTSDIELYYPDFWRASAENVKQGSSNEAVKVDGTIEASCKHLVGHYNHLLDEGVAPEMARMILPQNMLTEWIWSGSLDAFAAMCKLRCASDTQYESRVVADQISEKMGELFPVSWQELVNV